MGARPGAPAFVYLRSVRFSGMRNLQTNSSSQESCQLAREDLLISIADDLHALAELFTRLRGHDEHLGSEQADGIARAQAAVQRAQQLTYRLSRE